MPTPILVPKATISMEQGTILRWCKEQGEVVDIDEVLLELETDKAVFELPAPASGALLRIDIPSGGVAVDQVVGWIGRPGEEVPVSESPNGIVSGQQPAAVQSKPTPLQGPAAPSFAATPAARRLARERGIDIQTVQGTGPNGRIIQEDVERASASERVSPPSRAALIRHVTEAWQSVPHIHIARLVDASQLVEARKRAVAAGIAAISYTDLILASVARVLPQFPALLPDGRLSASGVALAFAVETEADVVAPVIAGADRLSLRELNERRKELAALARAHRLKPEHLQDGAFTVTNLGMFDVDFFEPIVNAPQVAILAVGRIAPQPVVHAGVIEIGWRMWANLAADHRQVDGALAARFLSAWKHELNQIPEELQKTNGFPNR